MEFKHYSVMLRETIEHLNIKADGIYLDGTLGGGGHAWEVCSRLKQGHFYGIDQDDAAIAAAGQRLADFGDKVTLIRNNYCNARAALQEQGIQQVDGILLDLGVSSYQLDTRERGFSYRYDSPLDMRMDRRQALTARDIVNTYSETELFHIIRDYGEDAFAKNIAKHIVQARERKPIETTGQLNEVIKAAIPAKMRQNGHPSKKTFQAIRIECNHELEALRGFGGYDRHAGSGRTAMHHHLPLPGGPDCKDGLQKGGKSLHMPAGISGVRLWKKAPGKRRHKKTGSSEPGGT